MREEDIGSGEAPRQSEDHLLPEEKSRCSSILGYFCAHYNIKSPLNILNRILTIKKMHKGRKKCPVTTADDSCTDRAQQDDMGLHRESFVNICPEKIEL